MGDGVRSAVPGPRSACRDGLVRASFPGRKTAGALVQDKGVVVPAVPQSSGHAEELFRALVAVGVLQMFGAAEIPGFGLNIGGDEVSSGPAVAEVVQRGKLSGDVIRLVIRCGLGGDEPDPVCADGQGCQEGEGFDAVDHGISAQRLRVALGGA